MLLLKIPFSKGGLGRSDGCEKAPEEIIKCLQEFCLTEGGALQLMQTDEIKVNTADIRETHNNIFEKVKALRQNFIAIGGDHSVTYSAFRAFAYGAKNPGIISFDAHPDMMPEFEVPTHENFLRMLAEDGIVKRENIILVGVRNWDKEEYNYIKQARIKCFTMKDIAANGREGCCDAIMSIAKEFSELYVSIDIDVVDPAFAPGTGYPEPGGMTTRELLYFLQRIKCLKNLRAADIVEVIPDTHTAKLGAKIVAELAW